MLPCETIVSLLSIVFVYFMLISFIFQNSPYSQYSNTVQADLGLKWHKTEINDLVMQLFRPTTKHHHERI